MVVRGSWGCGGADDGAGCAVILSYDPCRSGNVSTGPLRPACCVRTSWQNARRAGCKRPTRWAVRHTPGASPTAEALTAAGAQPAPSACVRLPKGAVPASPRASPSPPGPPSRRASVRSLDDDVSCSALLRVSSLAATRAWVARERHVAPCRPACFARRWQRVVAAAAARRQF